MHFFEMAAACGLSVQIMSSNLEACYSHLEVKSVGCSVCWMGNKESCSLHTNAVILAVA